MKKQDLSNLIEKHLNNECTPEEELLLNKFIEKHQIKNQNWNETDFGKEETMAEKIFAKVNEQIIKKNIFQRAASSKLLLKVAASILLLITISFGVVYVSGVFKEKPVELTWNEKTTKMGEKWMVSLPDGSRIILNADSKLKYPAHFTNASREVYLEGEAYFEIHHDEIHPFIVHSENLSTKVLGTKFNVSAFPEEKNISISLIEGSVKVSREESNGIVSDLVKLVKEQQLIYNKTYEIGNVEKFDYQDAVGWKDNILVFKKEPFANVLTKLERTYGIKFELKDKSYSNFRITGNFYNESIWTVSESLKKLTGLQYKSIKENNITKQIIFYKK